MPAPEKRSSSKNEKAALRVVSGGTSGEFQDFKPGRIKASLMAEVGLDEETAHRIAFNVSRTLHKRADQDGEGVFNVEEVRSLVNTQLWKMGLQDEARNYTRLGLSVFDIQRLLDGSHDWFQENGNLTPDVNTVQKFMSDMLLKEYTLKYLIPQRIGDEHAHAHLDGRIHIHDLDYFMLRPYCSNLDLRLLLRKGFAVPAGGAVSKPPKHLGVAAVAAANFLAIMQTQMAGGVGYSYWNMFLAPFLARSDARDKYRAARQAVQTFIFQVGQLWGAYRGSQLIFADIDFVSNIPRIWQDVPAVLPGGHVSDGLTYGDFEDEARILMRAALHEYYDGDGSGAPFKFPKPAFKITERTLKDDLLDDIARTIAKNGTPYLANGVQYDLENKCIQCCRYVTDFDESVIQEGHYLRLGALQVVSLNFPNAALLAKGDDDKLVEQLTSRVDLARDIFTTKAEIIKNKIDSGMLPILGRTVYPDATGGYIADKKRDGEPLWNIDRLDRIVGVVGLNECLKLHTDEELHESDDAWRTGLKLVQQVSDYCKEVREETGERIIFGQTPAESAAGRLAMIDARNHPNAIFQGTGDARYYTNSTFVRQGADVPLPRKVQIESAFHPMEQAETMLHIWLGEAHPDPEGIKTLIEKTVRNTLAAVFSFTKDFAICMNCNRHYPVVAPEDLRSLVCSCGGHRFDVVSRVTGYYSSIGVFDRGQLVTQNWNNGKVAEWRERLHYGLASP